MKTLLFLLLVASMALADGPGVIVSRYAKAGFPLVADPNATIWKGIRGVFADKGPMGDAVPGHRTEIRSRWTDEYIDFLFVCPYQQLHLKPNPEIVKETNQLWDWDVAEVFIGSDLNNIRHYYEFEISPRGEWVDLDINRDHPLPQGGWLWNSGFQNKARIDEKNKVWYGVMRIPFQSIDSRTPANGLQFRVNLYRCQGSDPGRKYVAWQPTKSRSFHVPEAFGRLVLEGK